MSEGGECITPYSFTKIFDLVWPENRENRPNPKNEYMCIFIHGIGIRYPLHHFQLASHLRAIGQNML